MQEVGGSIPPGSTKFPHMGRLGRLSLYLGIALTAAGLIGGFVALMLDRSDWTLRLLSLTPAGVLLCFAGVVGVVMTEPRDRNPDPD